MIEDVLGEGSVSASRFSRWFSNPSRSGSRSSSLRSTPHEELERLAGKTVGQCRARGPPCIFLPTPSVRTWKTKLQDTEFSHSLSTGHSFGS